MKVNVEEVTMGRFEHCLKLSCKRGKMNEVDITEAIAKYRYAEPSYFQIIVNPDAVGESDFALYDEGHTVILYPMDSYASTSAYLLNPIPPKMKDGKRCCPWCEFHLEDDMKYCPYCGQCVKGYTD